MLAGAISTLAVGGLAGRVFRDGRAAFFAAAAWQCLPAVQIAGVLMTIDGPYLACWAIAAWAYVVATRDRRAWAWPACGLALAAGFLFKYTILLLVVGLAIDLLRPRERRVGAAGPLAAALAACLGLAPVLVWNARHGWATVHHLLAHLALGGDAAPSEAGWSYSPLWTLEFVGLQLAVAGTAVVLMIAGIVGLRRAGGVPRPLLAASLPVFLFYLLVSLFTRVEGNWAMAGFVTLCPIAGWMIVDARERRETWLRVVWGTTALVGLLALLALPLAPVLARGEFLGRYIPINRISGMRTHAAAVQRLLDDLGAETGKDPFVLAGHYGRASQLAFYLPDNPTTYCASAQLGGEPRQYDLWPETSLDNPDTIARLRGRPAVILVGASPRQRELLESAFDSVEDAGALEGEPKASRTALVARGFRGFAPPAPPTDDGADP